MEYIAMHIEHTERKKEYRGENVKRKDLWMDAFTLFLQ